MYCTYLTTYCGNLLPPFYIGSTSVSNVLAGYRGSVKSKLFRRIWESEIHNNHHLFKTRIITYHLKRQEAIEKEFYFHKHFNVVKNPLYINQSFASPNGYFGRSMNGKNNPMYGIEPKIKGIGHTKATREKISIASKGRYKGKTYEDRVGKEKAENWKRKMSESRRGNNNVNFNKKGENHHSHNNIWINDGKINKFIKPCDLQNYPDFKTGRLITWKIFPSNHT